MESCKPLVSVITPAYNCRNLIAETMESVLSQTYENVHYHVIDDCSTDGTWEVMNHYYADHPNYQGRFQIERNAENIGEQKTFNRLFAGVRADYFMFVNADDPLIRDAISKLIYYMEQNPEVLCAYPDFESISENGKHRAYNTRPDYNLKYMVSHHNCLPSVGSMFRGNVSQLVGSRDASYRWLGDFDFWLRLGLVGPMGHVRSLLSTWRVRDGQASGEKNDERAKEHIRIIHKFYLLPNTPSELYKVRNEARCWSYLVAAAVSGSKKHTAYCLMMAIKSYPFIFLKFEFYDSFIRRALYILRR